LLVVSAAAWRQGFLQLQRIQPNAVLTLGNTANGTGEIAHGGIARKDNSARDSRRRRTCKVADADIINRQARDRSWPAQPRKRDSEQFRLTAAESVDAPSAWTLLLREWAVGAEVSGGTAAMMRRSGGANILADVGAKARIIDLRELITLDADPERQASLRRLLVEEENKLASNREQLENAAQRVSEGKKRLERIKRTGAESGNPDGAAALMELTQQLFENFHRRLLTKYPYSVKLQNKTVGVCATLEEARRRARNFANANPQAVITVVDARQDRSETVCSEP
jgi:hypothetical protein